MRVQPYLFFEGRCEEALDFYKSVLNAEVLSLMRYRESPVPVEEALVPPGCEDKIMHATFRVGHSLLMASDGRCEGQPRFEGVVLTISMSVADRAELVFTQLAEGGEVRMPLTETFFAQLFGMVADKFGLTWMIMAAPTESL